MTYPQPLPPAPPTTPWYRRPALTLLAVGGLVAAGLYARSAWDRVTATAFATAAAAPLPDDEPPPPTDPPARAGSPKSAAAARYEARLRTAEDAAADTSLKTRLAAAKAAQKLLTELGAEVARVLDEAAAEVDRWDKDIPPLLTNDDGRAVAARPEAVKAFRALYDLERPGRPDVAKIRSQVDTLMAPVETAFRDPNNVWDKTADAEKRLTALLSQAKSLRDAARNARVRVSALVTAAKRDGKPGAATLQDAVDLLVAEESLEAAALIAAARAKARREADRVLAETLEEADRRAGQTRAREEAAKAEIDRLKREREADDALKQAAKDKLRSRAKSAEVQRDLSVFLAKGYSQPGRGGSGFFDRTAEYAPVSFTRLQTGGYLDESAGGLKNLLRLGAEPNLHNDRPKWKFNAFRLDQSNEAFLKRVQAELRELGPVLVEEGLLAR